MFARSGFLWLLAQEGRVLWRGSLLVRSRRFVVLPVILVALTFQGIAVLVAGAVIRRPLPLPEMILVANLNLFFLGFLMLSRAMTSAIDVLYGRGDMDFLLAAPIPPGRVLAVRMLGVAASVAAPWMLLGGVLANALAARGQFWALAFYPMLAALGLMASAAAFAVVVALVGWLPPGRARRLGHLLSLLAGLLIFGLGQAPRFLPPAAMARLWRAMMPAAAADAGIAWVPGRAMLGAPAPLAACAAWAVLAFALVWIGLAGRFAAGAVTAAAYRPGASSSSRRSRFPATPGRAAFTWAMRLVTRFPGLLTQVIYRSLAVVPVLMILSGRVSFGAGPDAVAPLLAFLDGQLALFFISVLAASDQSPDLAASAPVSPATLRHACFAAAAVAVMTIMALPLAVIALRRPDMLPVLLAGMAAALSANLRLGQSLPIPLGRAAFGKGGAGSMLGQMLGVAISGACALVVWLAWTYQLPWLASIKQAGRQCYPATVQCPVSPPPAGVPGRP